MADKYCSTCFKTGEELDEALQAALACGDNATRAETAAAEAEAAVEEVKGMSVVRYTEQTLTDEQKAQARENVGAASAEEVNQALQEASEAFGSINTALAALGEAIPAVDNTMTVPGAAADAAAVGVELQSLTELTAEHERIIGEIEDDIAKVPVTIDLSALETDGLIVETYADGNSETTTLEFDSEGNPTKITDSDGNVTVLTW